MIIPWIELGNRNTLKSAACVCVEHKYVRCFCMCALHILGGKKIQFFLFKMFSSLSFRYGFKDLDNCYLFWKLKINIKYI